MDESLNVLGEPLKECCVDPITGFFRNGCCDTSEEDHGVHTVCARVTQEFLAFSKSRGNDLSTPRPESKLKSRLSMSNILRIERVRSIRTNYPKGYY